jgi:hypothetical protein
MSIQLINGLFHTVANTNADETVVTGLHTANLTITGNLTVPDGKLYLAGGSNGQVLTTYGNGTTHWTTPTGGSSGVTNVATGGSGLGFSLSGGPITSTGTITLATPNAASLRSSLSIGNVANINFNSSTTQFLRGDGTWVAPSGSGGSGSGTVTSVGGTGSVLGFSLSGTVTTTGNLTLAGPSAAVMRDNIGLGNIATINATGSTTNFLRADGTWQTITGSGSNAPNLNGSTTQFLRGDGTWATPGGGGTVTSVGANGSGLGFSLSTPVGGITDTGNITLNTPTTTALKTSLGLGNIVATNFNGNGQTALAGNGGWVTISSGSSSNVPNLSGNTAQFLRGDGWAALPVGNIATLNLNGNASQILYGNGAFAAVPAPSLSGDGNNISVVGTTVSLNSFKFAKEVVGLITLPSTSTVNIDLLTNSIVYNSANATTGFSINLRGSSTATMASMMNAGESITATAMITNGPTPQTITSMTIDGVTQTVKMLGGSDLAGSANSIVSYSFTVMMTVKSPVKYTVIGSKAIYK